MIGSAAQSAVMDQAAGLRNMMARRSARLVAVIEPREAGRQDVAAGLAQALARRETVLLIDESAPESVRHLTAGASTIARRLRSDPYTSLGEALATYGRQADVVMLDSTLEPGGGLSRLAAGAHDVLVVLRGSDATGGALTAAYATIKQLHRQHALMQFRILVTDCSAESQAHGIYGRLATVASRYLTVGLHFCGHLPPHAAGTQDASTSHACMNVARGMLTWGR